MNFWLNMSSTYPSLARKAIPQLLVFPGTRECEQGFSALMSIKTKNRSCLDAPGHDFRCAVILVEPRIDQLVYSRRNNCSLLTKYCLAKV